MEWMAIIEMILAFLAKCQENRAKSAILADMENPGGRTILLVRRKLRQKLGFKGRELRKATKRVFSDLAEMPMKEKEDLLEEALVSASDQD